MFKPGSLAFLPRPQLVRIGSYIYFEENVFSKSSGHAVFMGRRSTVGRVEKKATKNQVWIEVVRSEGVSAFPQGALIERPLSALYNGYDCTDYFQKTAFEKGGSLDRSSFSRYASDAVGGFLVGRKDGQTVLHTQGDKGGVLDGRPHTDGGIKVINEANREPLEFEGKEVVICSEAVALPGPFSFDGEKLSARQVLCRINESGGGKSFEKGGTVPAPQMEHTQEVLHQMESSKNTKNEISSGPLRMQGGEVVITKRAVDDPRLHSFEGAQLTNLQILSKINQMGGGLALV
jgi:hypothetical protein